LSKAVCGAKAPMPNTSKKFTTKPIKEVFSQLEFSSSDRCAKKSLTKIKQYQTANTIKETQTKINIDEIGVVVI
jgi:hypothetical protein